MNEKLKQYFREETCLMAAKYLRDRVTSGETTTKAMPWLRKACKLVSPLTFRAHRFINLFSEGVFDELNA